MNILGVDPGRLKTGLAAIDARGQILHRAIIAPAELGAQLPTLLLQWNVTRIALGDSTASQAARAQIEAWLQTRAAAVNWEIALDIVDETGSTLEARALYWADHARTGWRAWVPLSLQEPPEPVDDYAAVIVARRALPSHKAVI